LCVFVANASYNILNAMSIPGSLEDATMRTSVWVVAVAGLGFGLAAVPAGAGGGKSEWVQLFNGKDLSGWTVFLDPKVKQIDQKVVFTVKDGMIVCTGNPFGYLLTEKEYDNYVLKVQWKWTEGGGPAKGKRNSGVFVHVTGPNKIWPKAVEAQLMEGHAGDF